MDIPNKVWEKNGGNAFIEFLNSCSAVELKIVNLLQSNDVGLLNQYIVAVILPKFFREGFKLGSKYMALQMNEAIRSGDEN